jgi:hypothetical protein
METCKYSNNYNLHNNAHLNNNDDKPYVIVKDKNGLEFSKIKKNNYTTSFSMTNNNIFLDKLMNFDLVDLIYKLNHDIYEFVKLNRISENEAELITVTKHLFKDLGLPQRFTHLKIVKIVNDNSIEFHANSIIDIKNPSTVPDNAKQLPILLMKTICNVTTPHNITFNQIIEFDDTMMSIPPYIEKMLGNIFKKMFTRVKQFIENITL